MKLSSTREVLLAVKENRISISKADRILKLDALSVVEDVARLDLGRYLRRGVPEIIYARGKSTRHLCAIMDRLLVEARRRSLGLPIIASKVSREQAATLEKQFGSRRNYSHDFKEYGDAGIVALIPKGVRSETAGRVVLLSAGTTDIGVLDEAHAILEILGCETIRFNDVGIASLKRLVSPLKQILKFDPDAIIVAAGMEAALPSLIAGLSSVPVVGLPTSVGYGYGGRGEAALMSMLQACPLGICTVNIDGGVAAGIIAWLIARRASGARDESCMATPRDLKIRRKSTGSKT